MIGGYILGANNNVNPSITSTASVSNNHDYEDISLRDDVMV
jgi:hypothetical protein